MLRWVLSSVGYLRDQRPVPLLRGLLGVLVVLPFTRHPLALMAAAIVGPSLPLLCSIPDTWRFGRHTRCFKTLSGRSVELRYAPELQVKMDLAAHLAVWEQAQQEMEERFGFRLKRRLVIFLFPTMAELSRVLQSRTGLGALNHGDAVLAAADYGTQAMDWVEGSRHEVAHLFSAYVGSHYPPFKGEGLATWVQGSYDGKDIDMQALAMLEGRQCIRLSLLLDGQDFYDEGHYAYIVAGSFAGFVIRRYGWDCYRRFYGTAGILRFGEAFEKALGLNFMVAERLWRNDLLSRRADFGPELDLAICVQRLRADYEDARFFRCLEDGEALLARNRLSARGVLILANTYHKLGHYERAAALLGAIAEQDPLPCDLLASMAGVWCELGRNLDLLGQRDGAVAAYHNALACPDTGGDWQNSPHALARRHLERPYSEEEMDERVEELVYARPRFRR